MTGQVTALGIRDGDPAVLNALIDRRGAAVLAYCERACAPGLAAEAAAEAFTRFRATVIATPQPAQLDPEAALLAATRHAVAERSPRPAGATAGPIGRLLGGKAPEAIAEVPALLVARADGSLDPISEDRLNRLLDASAAARAAEERFHAGEYAYRTAVVRPLPPEIKHRVLSEMSAVAVGGNGALAAAPALARPQGLPDQTPVAEEAPVKHQAEDAAAEEPAVVEEPVAEEAPAEEAPVAEEEVEKPAAAAEEPAAEETAPVEEPTVAEEPAPAEEEAVAADEDPAEAEPDATVEWSLPDEELEPEGLDVEIAASRLRPAAGEDDPEHLQSASGAIEEPLVEEPVPAAAAPPLPPTTALPRLPTERHHFPGRSALAPAAAVVTVAAIGALVASGVFGGNDATPQLDTGIVRPRAVNAVPEGEVDTVVNDLRESANQARRQRLADRRDSLGAGGVAETVPESAPEEEPSAPADTPEPEAQQQDEEPAPADEDPPQSGGGADDQQDGATGAAEVDGTVPDETP